MLRKPLLCLVGGLMLILGGILAVAETTPTALTSPSREAPTLLAARYHLRTRTNDFHARARSGGPTTPRKTQR